MNEQNKQKKQSGANTLLTVLMMVQCVAMGILIAECSDRVGEAGGMMFAFGISMVIISMLLSTVIHEGGHLVGGLLSGYKFACFRVFALSISRGRDGKIRTGRLTTPGMGGQCLMSPPELKDGKMPFMLYHAGGFLMNLIFGVIFASAALLLHRVPQTAGGALGASVAARAAVGEGRVMGELTCWMMAIANIVSALTNGIPLKTNLISNDGQNMIDLRRSPAARRRHWTDMKIAAGIWQGERLKDMPDEWFSCPTDEELRENALHAGTAMMYYSRLMDEAGENGQCMSEARALSDRLLSDGVRLAGLHRAVLRMDRAFMEMIEDTPLEYVRREKIDQWLDKPTRQVMKAMRKGLTVQRIEYAQALLIEKDEEKAKKTEAKFEKMFKKYPVFTDMESERSLMNLVRQTHERRKTDEPKGESDGL